MEGGACGEVAAERLRARTCWADGICEQTKGMRLVVWGDDFTFIGHGQDLKEAADTLKQWYDIKVRAVLGPETTRR